MLPQPNQRLKRLPASRTNKRPSRRMRQQMIIQVPLLHKTLPALIARIIPHPRVYPLMRHQIRFSPKPFRALVALVPILQLGRQM